MLVLTIAIVALAGGVGALAVVVYKIHHNIKSHVKHLKGAMNSLKENLEKNIGEVEEKLKKQLEDMVKTATEKTAGDQANAIVAKLQREWEKQHDESIVALKTHFEEEGKRAVANLGIKVAQLDKEVRNITTGVTPLLTRLREFLHLGKKKGDEKPPASQGELSAVEQTP